MADPDDGARRTHANDKGVLSARVGVAQDAFGVAGEVQASVRRQTRALTPIGSVGADLADPFEIAVGIETSGETIEPFTLGREVENARRITGDVRTTIERSDIEASIPAFAAELLAPDLSTITVELRKPYVCRASVLTGKRAFGETADIDEPVGRH